MTTVIIPDWFLWMLSVWMVLDIMIDVANWYLGRLKRKLTP